MPATKRKTQRAPRKGTKKRKTPKWSKGLHAEYKRKKRALIRELNDKAKG